MWRSFWCLFSEAPALVGKFIRRPAWIVLQGNVLRVSRPTAWRLASMFNVPREPAVAVEPRQQPEVRPQFGIRTAPAGANVSVNQTLSSVHLGR